MRTHNYGLYAVAVAVVAVGALWAGVPVASLALLGLLLVCPLMMFVMMRGMHGGDGGGAADDGAPDRREAGGPPAPHDHGAKR